jgi:hypothetical protein
MTDPFGLGQDSGATFRSMDTNLQTIADKVDKMAGLTSTG